MLPPSKNLHPFSSVQFYKQLRENIRNFVEKEGFIVYIMRMPLAEISSSSHTWEESGCFCFIYTDIIECFRL